MPFFPPFEIKERQGIGIHPESLVHRYSCGSQGRSRDYN
jgi:hypothetical protein